jgi:hypothetical protein
MPNVAIHDQQGNRQEDNEASVRWVLVSSAGRGEYRMYYLARIKEKGSAGD